jgi:transcriptional regulator with XRE-family HTH domain
LPTPDPIAEIARRIVAARERIGLTQADLAAAAGVAKNTVSRIERGEYEPAVSTLLALAKALAVSLSELAGELEVRAHQPAKVSPVARRLRDVVDQLGPEEQRALLAVAEVLSKRGG